MCVCVCVRACVRACALARACNRQLGNGENIMSLLLREDRRNDQDLWTASVDIALFVIHVILFKSTFLREKH